MTIRSCSLFLLVAIASVAHAESESVNHAPSFQIYQYDDKVKDRFGRDASDKVCWPSAVAHRMMYFHDKKGYDKLRVSSDILENIATFVRLCHTGLSGNGGTAQDRKVPCILDFFRESGYSGRAYSIGASSSDQHRAVQIDDLLKALRRDDGLILHVGWFALDNSRHRYVEKGSHSLNAYGFDYEAGDTAKLTLKVANPGVNYTGRSSDQMFDPVVVSAWAPEPGVTHPENRELVLHGKGFDRNDRVSVLEDIFVFAPE